MSDDTRRQEAESAFAEGEAAGKFGKHFREDCPYRFERASVDPSTFEREWRHKLDAWFAGWKSTHIKPDWAAKSRRNTQ